SPPARRRPQATPARRPPPARRPVRRSRPPRRRRKQPRRPRRRPRTTGNRRRTTSPPSLRSRRTSRRRSRRNPRFLRPVHRPRSRRTRPATPTVRRTRRPRIRPPRPRCRPLSDGEGAMEGTLIGERYRLTQPIAQGRAGSVWIAQDTRVNRTVVAKPVALRSPQDASFALEQAKHAARLRHRCAVTVYDVLAEGPRVWIVSEYVPSRSMADFLDGHGRLAFADTAMLGTQVSAAVAAAHEIGLLHRAIEPSNVLLADDG